MAALRLQNVDFSYDEDILALKGVSLDVESGEFLGVIGPNGSGKTTMVRVLSRGEKPRSGSVLLEDEDIWDISPKAFARRVAVVPQDTSIAFDFSVFEVVLMGRSPHLGRFSLERPADIQAAEDAMRLTNITHLSSRSINALSGGETQRAIIARALAQQTDILLLDEPTSHLDLNYQFEIMDLLRALNRERGITVVVVMHDLNLAAQYCGRLVLMNRGEVLAQGGPEDVVTETAIREAYGAEVWVRKHPVTGRPYVISSVRGPGPAGEIEFDKRPRVHVICGGGTGAPIFARLLRRGYTVTAGVLNLGDADQEVAESFGMETVTVPPFSAVDEDAERRNIELARQSSAIILSDVPVGGANQANLRAALTLAQEGRPVFLLQPSAFMSRDFTGGEAAEIYAELAPLARGQGDSVGEILDQLQQPEAK